MQIQNMRINLNAHTAYHIYKLFEELKEEYFVTRKKINNILGVEGLSREENKYRLMTIDIMEWEEILFFARNHDWLQKDNEMEWNIFNNNCSRSSLTLSPNVNGTIRGDILAKISVSPNELWNDKLDLYWEPGFKTGTRSMDCFDNIVKWKLITQQNGLEINFWKEHIHIMKNVIPSSLFGREYGTDCI